MNALRMSLSNFLITTDTAEFIMFESMNSKTKITLSVKELELVCNTDWILTKHEIIAKVYSLFGDIATDMQQLIAKEKDLLPEEAYSTSPKISKGENYKLLPYVMLDYPRCFEKEKTLAIRTMFWWGNFFSIHLQLAGKCKTMFLKNMDVHFAWLQQNDYWICISSDPWHHHFGNDNYKLIKECSAGEFSSILDRESFIKIGKKLPLTQWNEAPEFIRRSFKEMIEWLKN